MQHLPVTEPHLPYASQVSQQQLVEFKARRTDVFVCSPPKTGTTLMQVVCHLLRGGGDDYVDLYEVSPFLELAFDLGQEINAADFQDHVPAPRVFKSHQLLTATPRGGRYICLVRDPAAAAISYYAFMIERRNPKVLQLADVDDFVRRNSDGAFSWASIWTYVNEYHAVGNDPNVLIVPYETVVGPNKRRVLQAVADFIGVSCDDRLLDHVMEQTTKEAMARNISRFDLSWASQRLVEVGRMAKENAALFQPCRRVVLEPHSHKLSDASLALLAERWQTLSAPVTGCATYAQFRDLWEERLLARLQH